MFNDLAVIAIIVMRVWPHCYEVHQLRVRFPLSEKLLLDAFMDLALLGILFVVSTVQIKAPQASTELEPSQEILDALNGLLAANLILELRKFCACDGESAAGPALLERSRRESDRSPERSLEARLGYSKEEEEEEEIEELAAKWARTPNPQFEEETDVCEPSSSDPRLDNVFWPWYDSRTEDLVSDFAAYCAPTSSGDSPPYSGPEANGETLVDQIAGPIEEIDIGEAGMEMMEMGRSGNASSIV